MASLESNLLPDEKIVFRTKKHWVIFSSPIVLLLFALFFCLDNHITMVINSTLETITNQIPVLRSVHRLPALVCLLLAIYASISPYLMYVTSDYVVTNKRIIMKQGFFDKLTRDTRLSTISHVTVDQGPLGQVLHFGNVGINSFGGSVDYFTSISQPDEFQKSVHSQLDQAPKTGF